MFDKSDKMRIYWLIDQYLLGEITERLFCDEFYVCYNLEISDGSLTNLEQKAFSNLDRVASRFSEYEEDHSLDISAFTTVQELRNTIMSTKKELVDSML